MPPIIKTDRESMLDAVIDIIESDGVEAVSARNVSARLNISTQPIYREFGDMEGLTKAARDRGYQIFWEYIKGDALDQAVKYVVFASEHKNLFRFLFGGAGYSYDGLEDLSHRLIPSTDIIGRIAEITSLSTEKAYRVHLYIWMALSGIAHCAVDNNLTIDENEIKEFTVELSSALGKFYKEGGGVRA
ncbi:MAG: TetR/AcrR family transcriptional regulator [Clostridiales bacterium]|nr:TetR/AcrR family transcriptional regulator [Clostridiales bacterium]